MSCLLGYSCKSNNESAVKPTSSTIEKSIETSQVKEEPIKNADISLEEKYAEIEKEKPAIKPQKPAPAKTVQEVKVQKQETVEKTEQAPIKVEEQKNAIEVKVKETETKVSNATKESSKPAVLPKIIPKQQVEDVPPSEPIPSTNTEKVSKTVSHNILDKLLSENVSVSGKVNYKGLQAQVAELDKYLSKLTATEVNSLTKNEQLAFWINAYNAFTIKKILDNYPLGSITDLDGGKPWDVKWIKLDGKTLSLNNIENDIIRPTFKEPRIHFAVNCAAKSCPPLMNKAWTANRLEADFMRQTKAFINNASHNKLSASNCQVSKIFEWYAVDFGDLITFLNKYSATAIDPSAQLGYKDYDWSLNQ